jgi:molybdopterin/thiamine biosynthesis adenylyltransferase/rhodanese-related sulfurtransferase/proteasome lid subunit RPN8/RPN11/molybdopterin converting factor small subunit
VSAIRLSPAAFQTIRDHGAAAYPHECCGALVGAAREGHTDVVEARPLDNVTDEGPRRRFRISAADYRAAERHATEAGAELVGFYHSHPDHPAVPSQYDLDHAWPNFSYVIVAVRDGEPEAVRSWRLQPDRSAFEEETRDMTRILIPTPLRAYTDRQDAVDASGGTIAEALSDLTSRFAELRQHLFTPEGRLRSFVNVYVNDEDIRYLQKEATPLKPGDVVSIIPSVAGGAPVGETVAAPELTPEEIKRYSRHLIMPEVGVDGQRRLKAASVLCIGAGGLGSPAALYLAAAGVGRLGIVDFDTVDFSNLHRQILHGTPDVGRPKLQSARDRLTAINPEIDVETYETALTSKNALDLFRDYDVILDGTDNFPTRYLVNDACVLLGKPNAYGSIFRFEGQASVFAAPGGPCYRCLYPEPPPPGLVPSCAEGGVLGVLPGVIGTIQATEAIKLILGVGQPLVGRLLLYDAFTMRFRELKLRRDPACSVCGDHPTVRALIDYDQFCGVAPAATAAAPIPETTVQDLKARLDRGDRVFVLDVREPNEYQICRIAGSTLIPLGELPKRLDELPAGADAPDIVVHCKMGGRSAKAVRQLVDKGFTRVQNLKGGILEWIDQIDPTQPKY